jgi:hypothetical protein
VPMNSECSRLEMVARAIYNHDGWWLFLEDYRMLGYNFLFLPLVDVHLM